MAASPRIKAQNIKFKIGGTDYACEVQALQEYKLSLTGIVSGDADSLYRLLYDNYGTEVAFSVAPQGNTTATTSSPIYEGTVIFDQLPPLEATAGEVMSFTVELTVSNSVHNPAATPPVYFGLTLKTS
jgi:hypothetical protein